MNTREYLTLRDELSEQRTAIAHLKLEASRKSTLPWEIQSELHRREERIKELEQRLDEGRALLQNGDTTERQLLAMVAVDISSDNRDMLRSLGAQFEVFKSNQKTVHPNRAQALVLAAIMVILGLLFAYYDFRLMIGVNAVVAMFANVSMWAVAAGILWLSRSV